jgi:hypothetical protein
MACPVTGIWLFSLVRPRAEHAFMGVDDRSASEQVGDPRAELAIVEAAAVLGDAVETLDTDYGPLMIELL